MLPAPLQCPDDLWVAAGPGTGQLSRAEGTADLNLPSQLECLPDASSQLLADRIKAGLIRHMPLQLRDGAEPRARAAEVAQLSPDRSSSRSSSTRLRES